MTSLKTLISYQTFSKNNFIRTSKINHHKCCIAGSTVVYFVVHLLKWLEMSGVTKVTLSTREPVRTNLCDKIFPNANTYIMYCRQFCLYSTDVTEVRLRYARARRLPHGPVRNRHKPVAAKMWALLRDVSLQILVCSH